jgi:hypothetical protein
MFLTQPSVITAVPPITLSGSPVGPDLEVVDAQWFDWVDVPAAAAGQTSFIQLFNQAGSGKRVYVYEVWVVASGITTGLNIEQHAAAIGAVSGTVPVNKFGGGAATAVQARDGSIAAVGGVVIRNTPNLAAGGTYVYAPPRPWVFDPGHGISLANVGVANQSFIGGFAWKEV